MQYSHGSNTVMRVIGVLDALTAQVQAWDFSKATADRIGRCWLRAATQYPLARNIYFVIDNWPVHFNPRVLDQLAKDPRIQLLPLPTYSPWLNNIEKLWRWVKQHVSHAHPWCDDFNVFKTYVRTELARCSGLPELHRYCGLHRLFSQ